LRQRRLDADGEARAPSALGLKLHIAAHRDGEPPRDVQAETEAAMRLSGFSMKKDNSWSFDVRNSSALRV
jgi:hypothetical protein